MIQYIVAAGLGALLGSAEKGKKKYKKGGELMKKNPAIKRQILRESDGIMDDADDLIRIADKKRLDRDDKMGIQTLADEMKFRAGNIYDTAQRKLAKGGQTEISREAVVEALRDPIEEMMEDVASTYEFYGSEINIEEIEHKSRDGFIPFTDGGIVAEFFGLASTYIGSGISMPTNTLQAELERLENNAYEYADENTDDEEERWEEIDEYLSDASIMFMCEAQYYAPDNDRSEDGKHTITLAGVVNMEAPYHRRGKMEDFKEITFTFSSIKDLEKKLESNLEKIKAWFDGAEFEKGRKLKFAKGGKVDFANRTSDDFRLGELVYDTSNKDYGTIIDIFDKSPSDKYEVKLDSDGMQPTANLRKLGEKGDSGSKKQLFDAVSAYERLLRSFPDMDYPPMINNPFYAKGGTTIDKPKVTSISESLMKMNGEVVQWEDMDNARLMFGPAMNAQDVADALIEHDIFLWEYAPELYEGDMEDEEQEPILKDSVDIDDIVDAIEDHRKIKGDNSYNYNAPFVFDYKYVETDDPYDEQLYFVREHRGGDVRGNYGQYMAFQLDSVEEHPLYGRISVYLETDKGDVTLDSESIEGYNYEVINDETGTFEEYENVSADDIEEAFDFGKLKSDALNIFARGGRTKRMEKGGQIEKSTRNAFKRRLDRASKHLDEADIILSRNGDHQGAYEHIVAAHVDGIGMKEMVKSKEGNFYKSTPAMKGFLDQYEDIITDLIIHIEDVKDIGRYNPDRALRRIGVAQRVLASVEGEHEKKGRKKMAQGGLAIHFDDDYTHKDDIENLLMSKTYMGDNEYLTDYGSSFYVYSDDISPIGVRDAYESIIEEGYDDNVELELFAKGGKTQGYNARLDESLAMRRGSKRTKKQGYKSRRHESEGMERSMGRRKYASVGTMDKGRRKMAHGGRTGREVITYNVYNNDGDVIRSADSIVDYDKKTITLPNGKTYKVKDDGEYTMKWQKTQVKARRGIHGLVKTIKEFSSPDNSFNVWAAAKFAPRKMEKGGVTDLATETLKKWNEVHSEKQFNRKVEKNRAFNAFKKANNVDVKADQRVAKVFVDGDEVGFALLISDTTGKPLKRLKFISSMAKGGCTSCGKRGRKMADGGMVEYLLYGVAKGKPDYMEKILFVDDKPIRITEKLRDMASAKGFDRLRTSMVDLKIAPDFTKALNFKKGGKTKGRKKVSDFDKLAMKVAARYRAQGMSNKKAMEIGRGTAGKVARQQQAKKRKK